MFIHFKKIAFALCPLIQPLAGCRPLLLMGIFLFACSTEQPKEQPAEFNEAAQAVTGSQEDEAAYVLPSPLQIATIFKKSGLFYSPDLTNPMNNASKYSSKLKKSLNFGVYSADLSYCVLNNQTQQALSYMKVVRQLSDELGISNLFNSEGLFDSFQKNIGNEDSMITILTGIQEKLDEYLHESAQEYMSAVYFTGGWIEAMYLGAQVVTKKQKENSNISGRLVEQMAICEMLLKGLEKNPEKSDELTAVINDLRDIKAVYESFDSVKKLNENEAVSLKDFTVTDDELSKIVTKISEIRSKLIS